MDGYDKGMIEGAVIAGQDLPDETLRDDLARGDAVLHSAGPVMRHLLSGAQHPIFSDEIVARVRGCLTDIARQLLGEDEPRTSDLALVEALTDRLTTVPGLVGHLHSLAFEWQLAERLKRGAAIDPVLPPLVQALVASDDATTSALAMNLLAAQARFGQAQRRMQFPLAELPADLLHGALLAAETVNAGEHPAHLATIRSAYDESRSRLGLIARLVMGMGGGAVAALAASHAGLAIFASALAFSAGQDRDVVILSLGEGQALRLALTLRAAGQGHRNIGEQLLLFHPGESLALDYDRLSPARAAALLAAEG